MFKPTTVFVRAHTESAITRKRRSKNEQAVTPKSGLTFKWPETALVIDCETTTDERQALTFGAYRYCRLENGVYTCVEEGLFFADDLGHNSKSISILQTYPGARRAETPDGFPSKIMLLSRSEFIKQVFWPAVLNSKALVIAFNLPFDLTRLALDCRRARRRNEGWSLVMSQDRHPETGVLRINPLFPWIKIRPKDSKAAFIRLTGVGVRSKKTGKRLKRYTPGRFLDLRTLGWALRNRPYTLQGACEDFGVLGKLDHKPTGRVTPDEIEYCREDVRATTRLLNEMRAEFDLHPIDLLPDRAYSPASIAKAYLRAMGLTPPSQKFKLPKYVLAAAMQAYYGGRAECRIRHTVVPVVHTDFVSEYSTVNTLMGLWRVLRAERLEVKEATEDVQAFLERVTPGMMFRQESWKELLFFALIQPSDDVLPVRTNYNGETTNIGVNPFTSSKPMWYAGPDLVASTLLKGLPPKVLKAFRIVPIGQQTGLKKVALRGTVQVDPATDEFFKVVVESKERAKSDESLLPAARKALSYFLKILASAGSYGLFVEVNPEPLAKGERQMVEVFSGETAFATTSHVIEKAGPWYCPPIAALITAAGRLLLALLERSVHDRGGTYLLCDTDSMTIVASENGGLVSCVADGADVRKALSWRDVDAIVSDFAQLNPYDRSAVPDSILKIEDVNRRDGAQREILGYSVSAKRYALFTRDDSGIQIQKASAHGLGYLFAPKPGYNNAADAPLWVVEGWEWILRGVLGLPQIHLPWFDVPAMMRFTITTPEVLKVLQARQSKLPYRDRVKPLNFIQSPIISDLGGHPFGCDPTMLTLVAPFSDDSTSWYSRAYINIHDGKIYRLGQPGRRLPSEADPMTLLEVISQYRWHPEAKSLAARRNSVHRPDKWIVAPQADHIKQLGLHRKGNGPPLGAGGRHQQSQFKGA
jgi:hypothetical protein